MIAFWATKQTSATICHSMAAMVAMERHLWVNLADIGQKERNFNNISLLSCTEEARGVSESLWTAD